MGQITKEFRNYEPNGDYFQVATFTRVLDDMGLTNDDKG
jgi:hypothetical protein